MEPPRQAQQVTPEELLVSLEIDPAVKADLIAEFHTIRKPMTIRKPLAGVAAG